ncbi:MAG: OmpA family protein [Myxococcus sp.]|nr:OmpA family protein [Myxococcus sp.]
MPLRLLFSCLVVLSSIAAQAQSGKLNLSADLGVGGPLTGRYGTGVGDFYFAQGLGPQLTLGVDYQLFRPLAVELLAEFGVQFIPSWLSVRNLEKVPAAVVLAGAGVGPRLRLLDTEKGNLWASAHVGLRAFDGAQLTVDAALGYQFALSSKLGLGPFVRGELLAPSPTSKRGSTVLVTLGVGGSFELLPFVVAPPPPPDDDGDGLTNESELQVHRTDPKKADTDDDGLSDKLELLFGTNPLDADTDHDGVPDGEEDKNRNGVVDAGETDPRKAPPPVVVVAPAPRPEPKPEPPPPPPDTDGDGLPDPSDNCPAVAGPATNQGCPVAEKQLVVITKEKLEILETVYFNTRDASVLPKSFPLLNQVAAILESHPEIKRVQIEGHTDNVGTPENNLRLSQSRANAVFKYLSAKVDPKRLEPIGYGSTRPAATNDTEAGRDKNRRVEFKIVAE